MLLMRLLDPNADAGEVFEYGVAQNIQVRITVNEHSVYTHLVTIEQLHEALPPFMHTRMQVRLYHDARVGEVVRYQEQSRFKGAYEYPNDKMHQKDEKLRLNGFLREWLMFCLQHGLSKAEVL